MSATALTSKERAYLRSLANTMDPIFQFGKGGLSDNFIKQIDDALEARELIKITLLENADADPKEIARAFVRKGALPKRARSSAAASCFTAWRATKISAKSRFRVRMP